MRSVSFVRRKFNAMLGVATVSMAVNFIVMLSGSLVAGNFLGKDSLAGIGVCTPVFAVASFLGAMVSVGSGLVFSKAMGEFDERRAAGVWSLGALLSSGIGVCLFLAMTFGGGWYLDYCAVTGDILTEAASYWRWQCVSMALTPLLLLGMAMVYADGDNVIAMAAGGCYVVGTIGFSILFASLSGHAGGISGGTAVAVAIVLAVLSLHFLRRNNHLRFVRCFSWRDLKATLVGSAPDSLIYLCWGLLVLVVNRFTVAFYDEELLAVVALGVSIVQFSIVFDGVGEALIPLGGMYAGEKNDNAMRELANHSALVAVGEGLLAGAVMFAFAPQIAAVYGFRGEAAELFPVAVTVVRILAFGMPFMALLMMMNTHYLVVGHAKLAIWLTVLKDFLLPCVFVLLSGPAWWVCMWGGIVIGYVVAAACPLVYVRLVYKRSYFPWLVKTDDRAVDFSICLDRESLSAAEGRIRAFLSGHGVGDAVTAQVLGEVEASGLVALEKNGPHPPCVEYLVSLAKSGSVRLIIRDDGVTVESPSVSVSDKRYLNTLNCNRTEYRFSCC